MVLWMISQANVVEAGKLACDAGRKEQPTWDGSHGQSLQGCERHSVAAARLRSSTTCSEVGRAGQEWYSLLEKHKDPQCAMAS